MKILAALLSIALIALLMTACSFDKMWEDLAGKSTSGEASLQGFAFSTSVDASGNVSPKLEAGLGSTGIFNHLPSDGPMVERKMDKSVLPYGDSSLGSTSPKYASKNALQNLSIITTSYGGETITISEYEPTGSAANEKLAAYMKQTPLDTKLKLDELWAKKKPSDLAKQLDDLKQFRDNRKDLPQTQEIAAMPDSILYSLHPSTDVGYNRLVGDEVMYRELTKRLATQPSK